MRPRPYWAEGGLGWILLPSTWVTALEANRASNRPRRPFRRYQNVLIHRVTLLSTRNTKQSPEGKRPDEQKK